MKNLPLSLIVIALVITACGSKPKRTPTSPPPTETLEPTPTPITRPPDGTYSTKVTKDELITVGMDEYTACENAGTFELTLAGDKWNIIQTAAPGCTVLNPTFGGTAIFSAGQVKFHDAEPFGCSEDYTYQWEFSGTGLRFTSVDDAECAQRAFYMSHQQWIKQK